jgi:hypothetical protein
MAVRAAPLHATADGDDRCHSGRNGYNPAARVGTLDGFNVIQLLRELY